MTKELTIYLTDSNYRKLSELMEINDYDDQGMITALIHNEHRSIPKERLEQIHLHNWTKLAVSTKNERICSICDKKEKLLLCRHCNKEKVLGKEIKYFDSDRTSGVCKLCWRN